MSVKFHGKQPLEKKNLVSPPPWRKAEKAQPYQRRLAFLAVEKRWAAGQAVFAQP